MLSSMSYLQKLKKMYNGKLPKSFPVHMKYMEFKPNEKEKAAKDYFLMIMKFPDEKKKAKKLGLI